MKHDKNDMSVNAIVKKLIAKSVSEPITKLEGLVGSLDNNIVRLYKDLCLKEYSEFSRDAVLHSSNVLDDQDGRVVIFVKASTKINVVSIRNACSCIGNHSESEVPSVLARMKRPSFIIESEKGLRFAQQWRTCGSISREMGVLGDALNSGDLSSDEIGVVSGALSNLRTEYAQKCMGLGKISI